MQKNKKIEVMGSKISILRINEDDYISLTNIAKHKGERADQIIGNWMRNRNTVEFLGLWEKLNNLNFKPLEFEGFKKDSGLNAFLLSPKKWIEGVNAIGIFSKSGKYGGTYAHKDIAFEFANWISVEFRLYFIKEFQRLKQKELNLVDWSAKRFLTKINYKIHTDAIKENIIPKILGKNEINYVYSDEADILNKALFSKTAKEWRNENPDKKGNIRDYADIEQLIILANIESMNAEFIKMGIKQSERLKILNKTSITQIKSLLSIDISKRLSNDLK